MTLVLVRVDDRLIHGQVVVGWGQALTPDLLILADDTIAQNDWERELYRTGVPPGIDVDFVSVGEAADRIDSWAGSRRRTILLVGDVDSLMRLCRAAPQIRRVNLGGIHGNRNRKERLPYLFLSDDEAQQLRRLEDRGVEVTAQDVPNAAAVPLGDLL